MPPEEAMQAVQGTDGNTAQDTRRIGHLRQYILNIESSHPSGAQLAEFRSFLEAQGYSLNSVSSYLKVANRIRKPISQVTAEDVERFCDDTASLGGRSAKGYKTFLRRLLEWFNNKGWGPGEGPVETLKADQAESRKFAPKKKADVKLPAYLTVEELEMIQRVAKDAKWKAFFAALFASGARPSELVACNVGDAEIKRGRTKWTLRTSKTQPRTLPWVKEGTQELLDWLKIHPGATDPAAPLFLDRVKGRLSYGAADIYFRTHAKPAAEALLGRTLGKPGDKISLHTFRHSRATNLASSLTPSQLGAFFGWSQASKMMNVYVNGTGIAAEDGMRRHYGEPVETEAELAYPVVTCQQCGYGNTDGSRYCSKCGLALAGPAEGVHEAVGAEKLAFLEEQVVKLAQMVNAMQKGGSYERPEILDLFPVDSQGSQKRVEKKGSGAVPSGMPETKRATAQGGN